MSANGEQLEGVDQAVPESEFDRVELELARFDLGVIEDLVDDRHERVGRRLDQLEIFSLLGLQRGFEGNVGQSHDGVHRRANFVADVGEKFALGAIGRLGGVLGNFEVFFLMANLGSRLLQAAQDFHQFRVLAFDLRHVVEGCQRALQVPSSALIGVELTDNVRLPVLALSIPRMKPNSVLPSRSPGPMDNPEG